MQSRLDRYNNSNKELPSRLSKNKNLYDELNNKIGFEEIVDFDTETRIELTSLNDAKKSRESYQQLKDYKELIDKDNEDEEIEVLEEENKVFDINAILEEERKNRNELDELEKKRKLKNGEYSVLSDLNKKYLYDKDNKNDAPSKDKYEGLEELINTITSKTLVNDIKIQEAKESTKEDKGLLDELVATSVDLQVNVPSQYENSGEQNLVNENSNPEENTSEEETIDNSFYTRSMDLSKDDFDFSEYGKGVGFKKGLLITLVVIVLLLIICVVAYFILQSMGIKILDIKI